MADRVSDTAASCVACHRWGGRLAKGCGGPPEVRRREPERHWSGWRTAVLGMGAAAGFVGGMAMGEMLDHGAATSARCERLTTALHWAASMGHLEVCELLVERGAVREQDARRLVVALDARERDRVQPVAVGDRVARAVVEQQVHAPVLAGRARSAHAC